MEIVIKIDDNTYKDIVDNRIVFDEDNTEVATAIINGTPLPKGHGIFYDVGSLDKTVAELNLKRVHEITRGQCKLIREVIMHLPILVGEDDGGVE